MQYDMCHMECRQCNDIFDVLDIVALPQSCDYSFIYVWMNYWNNHIDCTL